MTTTIHLAGYRCHTCTRAMLFALPELPTSDLAALTISQIAEASRIRAQCYTAVDRVMWLIGAVELAPAIGKRPATWQCWACSLERPGNRQAADSVQHRMSRAERVGFDAASEWGRK
jgi:hypothetical protein